MVLLLILMVLVIPPLMVLMVLLVIPLMVLMVLMVPTQQNRTEQATR